MSKGRIILTSDHFALTIERLCHQLIERYDSFENTCMVGIQDKGVYLANRIYQRLLSLLDISSIEYGKLDITFYRDDFRLRKEPLKASYTDISFPLDDKKVILIDDVLYTGADGASCFSGIK